MQPTHAGSALHGRKKSDADLQGLLRPEEVCFLESCLWGQQRLRDLHITRGLALEKVAGKAPPPRGPVVASTVWESL